MNGQGGQREHRDFRNKEGKSDPNFWEMVTKELPNRDEICATAIRF